MTLETIELLTADNPTASVIWLHGLGADGHDFEALVPQLNLPKTLAIRFIFPHAPNRPITLNNNYVMRGWYDICSLEFNQQEDAEGIQQSSLEITQLIKQENERGIPCQRILLAGFSQGGAVVLHTALRYPEKLAGVMALSTYLPLHKTFENEMSSANKNLPIFMAHGLQDEIVKYQFGMDSKGLLEKNNYSIEWHEYTMRHSVCADEVGDIKNWLQQQLGTC